MFDSIELPEELKSVSTPKFKVSKTQLIILNRPYMMDWIWPAAFILIFVVMILSGELSLKDTGYGDYAIAALIMISLLIIQYFSLNRVCIDFEKKLIAIKNYNPLVNLGRKMFQMPFAIPFKEVDKIFTVDNFLTRQIARFDVVLETDAPYRFRIAIFSERQKSIVFAEYLNHKIC